MVIKSMNKKFKKGFSLFEAFVVMLIVSIFVVLMANTVAHRPKDKVASEAHGRFECYYDKDNGKLYQQLFTEGSSTGRELAKGTITLYKDNGHGHKVKTEIKPACEFIPPSYAKYLIIDAVGGGAGGSFSGSASEGQFVSTFYATIERKYLIIPGKGGKKQTSTSGAESGTETIVYTPTTKPNESDNAIIVAAGGKSLSTLENTTLNDVLACSITEWCTQEAFDCHITPTCQIKEGKLYVSFCRSKGSYVTVPITYKENKKNSDEVQLGNPRNIVNNIKDNHGELIFTTQKNANTWVYHDISQFSDYNNTDLDPTSSYRNLRPDWKPKVDDVYVPSMYTMELLMNTTAEGNLANSSNLHRLMNSMQYKSKMIDAKVGQGGAKVGNSEPDGKAGGALFLW